MKIDKRNFRHWLVLLFSTGLVLLTIPTRLLSFRKKTDRFKVVLYGHKLNGNLLALYEYLDRQTDGRFDCSYLTIDGTYSKKLKSENIKVLSGLNLRDVYRLANSDVIITDHGLHHFVLLLKLTKIRFIDVWHGVPYKGFDENDFGPLRDYDQVWVSSKLMKEIYISKYKFPEKIVKDIGYARVERLLNYPDSREELLKKYGLKDQKTILIAPTWKQDEKNRSIIPFGLTLADFAGVIAESYGDSDLQIIFRAHLNTSDRHELNEVKNVHVLSYADYPVAEDFLIISDVLITDWSSIAFDFMVLNRPTIFMDVAAPFAKGFSLGPEYRFGSTPSNPKQLSESISHALNKPKDYQIKYRKVLEKAEIAAYGDTLDEAILKRSVALLEECLSD